MVRLCSKLAALALCALVFTAGPASAQDAPWRVTEAEGVVRVANAGAARADAWPKPRTMCFW